MLLTAFDMDPAGNSATKRGITLAQSLGFDIRVVKMPLGLDPADVSKKDPDKLKKLVEKAESIHDFYFENAVLKFDKTSLDGKKKISEMLLPIIKKIPNKIEQSVWVKDLAEVLAVSEESVLEELEKIDNEDTKYNSGREEINLKLTDKARKKTRKQLLEEELAIFAVKSPESVSLLQKEDFEFISPEISKVLMAIKEKGRNILKTGQADSLSDKKEDDERVVKSNIIADNDYNGYNGSDTLLDYFILKSEIEEIGGREAGKEFERCLEEIRKLAVKNELDKINREIKKAEAENNTKKAEELVKKFNEKSKLLK